MPNWCSSRYIVIGDDRELNDLYEKMSSLEQNPTGWSKNDFGSTWLGNLLLKLGEDPTQTYCRGWFNSVSLSDSQLEFYVESAWMEPYETINVLKRIYPELAFYFTAAEPGCQHYVTNDAEGQFFSLYEIRDGWDGDWFEFYDKEKFLSTVADLTDFPSKIDNVDDAVNAVEAYNESRPDEEWIELIVYEIVD